jgi:hypothetical protein
MVVWAAGTYTGIGFLRGDRRTTAVIDRSLRRKIAASLVVGLLIPLLSLGRSTIPFPWLEALAALILLAALVIHERGQR